MGVLGWSLTIVGLLAGLVSLLTLVGLFIPRDHVATREITLPHAPAEVWALLNDAEHWPAWWKLVNSVDRLADRDGKPAVLVHYEDGNQLALVFREAIEPSTIVTEIGEENRMFGGTWTYSIKPVPNGCVVRITENGFIPNPFVRAMAKMMMDPSENIVLNLTAQAEHFGAPADIRP